MDARPGAVRLSRLSCRTLKLGVLLIAILLIKSCDNVFTMSYVVCVSRVIEYADHLHEHFVHPVITNNGNYVVPMVSTRLPDICVVLPCSVHFVFS